MRTCPQCSNRFGEEYAFCLNDGTPLPDDSGEIETRVVPRVSVPRRDPTNPTAACPVCGNLNRSNSKFCKKCGKAIPVVFPSASDSAGRGRLELSPTQFVSSDMFNPPGPAVPTKGRGSEGIAKNLVLGGVLGAFVIIGVFVIYSLDRDEPAANTNSARATSRPGATGQVGQTGRLTTDMHIRMGPTKAAESGGTHYKHARVKIVEETSYDTEDGWTTWWRVEVIQNGCSAENPNNCGNNWERDGRYGFGEARMTGWMNSKYIALE